MNQDTMTNIHLHKDLFESTSLIYIIPDILDDDLKERWWARMNHITEEIVPPMSLEDAFEEYPSRMVSILNKYPSTTIRYSDFLEGGHEIPFLTVVTIDDPQALMAYLDASEESIPHSNEWKMLATTDTKMSAFFENGCLFVTPKALKRKAGIKIEKSALTLTGDGDFREKWLSDLNNFHNNMFPLKLEWVVKQPYVHILNSVYFLVEMYIDELRSEQSM